MLHQMSSRGGSISLHLHPWQPEGRTRQWECLGVWWVFAQGPPAAQRLHTGPEVWERMNRTGIEGAKTSSVYRWRRCQLAPRNSGFGESGPEVLAEQWPPGGNLQRQKRGHLASFLSLALKERVRRKVISRESTVLDPPV